jgi:hypothetical protein
VTRSTDEQAISVLEKRYLKHKRRRLNKKLKQLSERLSLSDEDENGGFNNSANVNDGIERGDESVATPNEASSNRMLISTNKKAQRQQRLLEKVANLGSSPINVIQAIAAKALNFKLKNSRAALKSQSQQQLPMDQAAASSSSSSLSSLANANKVDNF